VVPSAYSAITASVMAASGMWLQSSVMARSGQAPRRTSIHWARCAPARAPMARAASTKRMSPWIESSPTPSMRTGIAVGGDCAQRDEVRADDASPSTCSLPGVR
jgi:hypothetical protein